MAEAPAEKRSIGRPKGFDREKALCSALELFWQKGYEPTSVAELCAVMAIKPPSLYCCFGSKSSLFIEAIRFYEEKYWTGPSERFVAEPDIYKAVASYFDEAARLLLSPHAPCGCMIVLAAINIAPSETDIMREVRSLRMKTRDMFAERLGRAIADDQIPPDTDVPSIAGSLYTYLEGLSLQARDGIFLSQLLAMAKNAINLLPKRQYQPVDII